jgi:hypothetical protein
MLGQNGVQQDTKQRAAKNAREHDQADCDGTHTRPPTFAQTRSLYAYCSTRFPQAFEQNPKVSILDQSPIYSHAAFW